MGKHESHQQVIIWKTWNKTCTVRSFVCLLPCFHYPRRLPSADFPWFSRHRDLFRGFPHHPNTGHSFPPCTALDHFCLFVFDLYWTWKVKLVLSTFSLSFVWNYLFLSSPVLLSQWPTLSSSIYTSISKQTITLDGPPQPPTHSHTNPGEWRGMEDWEGVGALGGNKSPADADIIRGTEITDDTLQNGDIERKAWQIHWNRWGKIKILLFFGEGGVV